MECAFWVDALEFDFGHDREFPFIRTDRVRAYGDLLVHAHADRFANVVKDAT